MIQSGETVPGDGIWEPVDIADPRTSVDARSTENSGCFNYLVAGTEAPNLSSVDAIKLQIVAKPTHWRLLWEDDRYRDGIIPDESQYFLASVEVTG